jgi:hypothetical protein
MSALLLALACVVLYLARALVRVSREVRVLRGNARLQQAELAMLHHDLKVVRCKLADNPVGSFGGFSRN